MKNQVQNQSSKGGILGTVLVIFIVMGLIGSCSGTSTEKEYRCGSCKKIFTNSTDIKSIIRTNMCEPCYENFKYIQNLQEEMKKYEERNR